MFVRHFPLRSVLASQREPRGESDPGKKGQTCAQRAPSPSRDRAHVLAARNHKSDTSILRRERIEHIEREFKTIQGLIRHRHRRHRLVSYRENLSRAPSTARCTYAHAAAVAQPFFYIFTKHTRCAIEITSIVDFRRKQED